MPQTRIPVDKVASLCTLKACSHLRSKEQGRLVHDVLIKDSLEAEKSIGNSLVGLYVKCGSLDDAQCVFDKLSTRDVVSWSALIGGYAKQGYGRIALELFQEALLVGLTPNRVTFLSVLKACGNIPAVQDGMLIHNQICRVGMEADTILASSLVHMYAKCGILEEAQVVFDKVGRESVVPWNAIISGYIECGDNARALDMLQNMELRGINPNKVTFLCVLRACQSFETLVLGRMAHDETVRTGLIFDTTVGNALVDMYCKGGSLEEAEKAFHMLKFRTVVSWSAIVDGFIRHGQHLSALQYYMRMQEEKILPDEATLSSILGACIVDGLVKQGKLIHDHIIRGKLEACLVIGSALVNMYAKSGFLREAHNVLYHLPSRSAVSWGALIAGYLYYGHSSLAIEAFHSMQREGIQPDKAASVCTLKGCANVRDLKLGRSLHHQLTMNSCNADTQVGTVLVDMYGKNSCLEDARRVFDCSTNRDVVMWGALIGGYVFCKELGMANDCLKEMQQQGLRPSDAIYTSVISGCSYAGQVTEGCYHFECMAGDYEVKPKVEQYTCMVDLLGRSGSLREAKDVIHTMPMLPDYTSWTSFSTSCKVYGDRDLAQQRRDKLIQEDQHDHSTVTKDDVKPASGNFLRFGNHSSRETQTPKVCPNLDTHKDLSMSPTMDQLNPVFCNHCERLAFALGLPKSKNRESIQLSLLCSACHDFVYCLK